MTLNQNRKTMMLDAKTENKLRKIQAKRIKETKRSCSLSKIINEVLKAGLKK